MSEPKFELSPQCKAQVRRLGHVRLGGYGALDPDPIKVTDPNREFVGEIWRQYVPDGILRLVPPPTSVQAYKSKAAEVVAKKAQLEQQMLELKKLEEEEAALAEKKRLEEERAARLAAANPTKGEFEEKGAARLTVPAETPEEASDPAPVAPKKEAKAEKKTPSKSSSSKLAAAAKKRGRRKGRRLSEAKAKRPVETQEAPDPIEVPEPEELDVITSDTIELPTKTEIRSYTRAEAENMAKTLGIWDSIKGTGKDDYRTAPDIEKALLDHVEKLRS
jgi:hypothetical protein